MKHSDILFLSPHNSVRSQIAEAWARSLATSDYDIYSAGSQPTVLDPAVTLIMCEIGIDVSGQRAKPIRAIPLAQISTVVTLCRQNVWPERPARLSHHYCSFTDVARATETDAQADRLRALRTLRDQIGRVLTGYFRRREQSEAQAVVRRARGIERASCGASALP
jgi:arsenate reductase